MLRHWNKFDYHSILVWASLFSHHLGRQKSLASFLWIAHQSQEKRSRLLWYQTCFFFASLSKHSERIFFQLFQERWTYSIFFFLKNQSFFFRSLECYFQNSNYLNFKSSYFRATSYKIPSRLLPFSNFHLRAPGLLFLLLWYHAEHLRMRFFNDYVKSHDLLCHSAFLPLRFRYQRTLFSYRVRGLRKPLLRWFFFFASRQQKHVVVEFQGAHKHFTSFSFSKMVVGQINTPTLKLFFGSRKLPSRLFWTARQRFFIGFNYLQLNLWSNTLLAQNPLKFSSVVRMDWSHYFASFPIFLFTFRLRRWIYHWSTRLISQMTRRVYKEYSRSSFDLFLISSLENSLKPLLTSYRFYFLWTVSKLRVNKFWNYWVLDRWSRITVYTNTRTKAKMFPMNYQYFMFIFYLKNKRALFGNWIKISPFFTKTLLPLDFLFWRLTSNGFSYRQLFVQGQFSLDTAYRRITLDHYAQQRFLAVRFFLEKVMQRSGFFMTSPYTHSGLGKNPWNWRRPYHRLPNGVLHPQEPRVSFKTQLYFNAVRRFVLLILRRSFLLSLLSFFLFFQKKNNFLRLSFLFQEITKTSMAYQLLFFLYRTTSLKKFRRYPHKVFVHSRKDPSFRARWFSFADRMRRAGLKRSLLPYYPESDETDIVADLTKRNVNALWNKSPIYWIII